MPASARRSSDSCDYQANEAFPDHEWPESDAQAIEADVFDEQRLKRVQTASDDIDCGDAGADGAGAR